jgi:intein/homing endonuclease
VIKTTCGDVQIKDICKNPNKYKILTFNHQTNQIETSKVEAFEIKPNINNWYELELENGIKLKVTGNHKIWCENLQCYRRVDQLDGTEDLIYK